MLEITNNFNEVIEETKKMITNNWSETIKENETNIKKTTGEKTIILDEFWGKHLFWPRPDVKKMKIKNKIKLPFAVTWMKHLAMNEKVKLKKEEELLLKRKRREGLQTSEYLRDAMKNKIKIEHKLVQKDQKNQNKIQDMLKMKMIFVVWNCDKPLTNNQKLRNMD